MNEHIKDLLNENVADSYHRYNESHPLELYLGKDQYGRKSLAVVARAQEEIKTHSSKIISVEYYPRQDDEKMLSFSLLDDDYFELFCKFCEDLISNTENRPNDENVFTAVINRWEAWLHLFSKDRIGLSEEEIRGIVGELYFFKEYMVPKYGAAKALESYVGPLRSHKDFEIENLWYEVKSPHFGWTSLKISSIEQLDAEQPGELVVVTLDKAPDVIDGGITLNTIFQECQDLLGGQKAAELSDKLISMGYVPDEQYDQYAYRFIGIDYYSVDKNFPKITANQLPKGVIKASYEISKLAIEEYKINDYE